MLTNKARRRDDDDDDDDETLISQFVLQLLLHHLHLLLTCILSYGWRRRRCFSSSWTSSTWSSWKRGDVIFLSDLVKFTALLDFSTPLHFLRSAFLCFPLHIPDFLAVNMTINLFFVPISPVLFILSSVTIFYSVEAFHHNEPKCQKLQ